MRCTRHPCSQGSVGVCASCLRERLLALIEARAGEHRRKSDEDRRKSDAQPPPLLFPRSVSPYICRRSDASEYLHHHRFYSTPQVGPTFLRHEKEAKKKSRFSRLASLFGVSRSEEIEKDPRVSTAPIASTSWFSGFRKKKSRSRLFSLDDEIQTSAVRPTRPMRDRGMSPEREGESPTWNGYSCESSPGWRKSVSETSVPVPLRRGSQCGVGGARNVSGFAFCLSPLVRASPSRHHRHDSGFSSELRRANRQHLSTAASLCANRSRKLADIGRAEAASHVSFVGPTDLTKFNRAPWISHIKNSGQWTPQNDTWPAASAAAGIR